MFALFASCSGESAGAADSAAQEVRDLIVALTPPALTEIPVVKSEAFATRKRTLERLRQADAAVGLEALRVYQEAPPKLPEVRAGLLDVAAHTAPKACEELLVQLVITFGEDLTVRRAATEFLGACLPERALVELEPILHGKYDDRTLPPEERILAAWIQATEILKKDPVPLLAEIGTDIHRPQEVRHLAAKTLGRFPSPQGRQALELLLVESTGNGYIRRLALQSLLESLPKDEFCKLAKATQDREADTAFIVFLQDALDKNCR